MADSSLPATAEAPAEAIPADPEKNNSNPPSSPGYSVADADASKSNDPNVVDWDGPDDPAKPQNWPASKKWGNVAVVSAITLITSLSATMFSPGISAVMSEFDNDSELLSSFTVSVYVLGFALAPLAIAPLSELYGRLYVYHICGVLWILTTVGCALSTSLSMLIAFRFLAGCAGAAPLGLGGGTISDLFSQERRGGAMTIWSLGPLVGPIVGPIAGGFLAEDVSWRWVFWVLVIAGGVVSGIGVLILRETYPVILLERKTAALRSSTSNPSLQSALAGVIGNPATLFQRTITRPMRLLLFSPIVLLMAVYMAVCYGYLFLLFSTFPPVFQEQYGFSVSTAGLAFLGIGIGMFLGVIVLRISSDRILTSLAGRHGGELKPEYRLPAMIGAAPFLPIGLFWYGWAAEAHTHWIVPILGTGVIGFGILCIFIAGQTYLIDAYPLFAASAMAGSTVLRSLLGSLLPLSGLSMYRDLGLGWGNSLLGFIAVAFTPVPLLFYRYGETLRKKFTFDL